MNEKTLVRFMGISLIILSCMKYSGFAGFDSVFVLSISLSGCLFTIASVLGDAVDMTTKALSESFGKYLGKYNIIMLKLSFGSARFVSLVLYFLSVFSIIGLPIIINTNFTLTKLTNLSDTLAILSVALVIWLVAIKQSASDFYKMKAKKERELDKIKKYKENLEYLNKLDFEFSQLTQIEEAKTKIKQEIKFYSRVYDELNKNNKESDKEG
ncbi:hypothetical protein [Clostridium magnum]|uniref:hypothetical protein n=1 Tax=Clostridium magnum TaxID=33954 RepID=UPI000916E15A|nr:hypothetical protein [Clostridium magnum]SHJ12993.1 hypothetical protein SAMN02745944_05404 [Clostridium magnum DSM 2767]